MFESIFNSVATGAPLDLRNTLISIGVSLALGLVVSFVYLLSTKKNGRSPQFFISLAVLPAIVAVIIILIGGNLARAFSMAGVFTLVRFRSTPGDSKDITFVFYAMAVGLSTGLGYLTLGSALTVIIGIVIILLGKIGFGVTKQNEKKLKITIPEDMNYQGAFDEIFNKYTTQCSSVKVRTSNLGTLYELTYHVILKEDASEKEFIDELRCRNGNLGIQLSILESNEAQF